MKKVLLVFDGNHFSKGAFEFLKNMNKNEPVMAIGLFLPAVDYSELLYSLGGLTGPIYASSIQNDPTVTLKNIKHFESICQQNGIRYRVHANPKKHVIAQLREETRFSDLLILSDELLYSNLDVELQEDYEENILHKAECPVLLISETYYEPKTIIMAYDGRESSIYAIKQFLCLFPEYQELKGVLAYINTGAGSVPEKANIEEYIKCHFKENSLLKLKIKDSERFEEWVLTHENPLLVTGAYGRSLFSELLKESFIKASIRDHKVPIFVAHK